MASTLQVVARLKALPGREAELDELIGQFVSIVGDKDPGTRAFGFYRDRDANQYVAIESYESSEAAAAHVGNVGHLFEKLGGLVDPEGGAPLQVYGDPSDEVRELYAPFGAEYHEEVGAI
jgi:quinol monooxygenase YgiN